MRLKAPGVGADVDVGVGVGTGPGVVGTGPGVVGTGPGVVGTGVGLGFAIACVTEITPAELFQSYSVTQPGEKTPIFTM